MDQNIVAHCDVVLISTSVKKDFTTVHLVRSVSIGSIPLAVSQFVSVVSFLVVPTVVAWVCQL